MPTISGRQSTNCYAARLVFHVILAIWQLQRSMLLLLFMTSTLALLVISNLDLLMTSNLDLLMISNLDLLMICRDSDKMAISKGDLRLITILMQKKQHGNKQMTFYRIKINTQILDRWLKLDGWTGNWDECSRFSQGFERFGFWVEKAMASDLDGLRWRPLFRSQLWTLWVQDSIEATCCASVDKLVPIYGWVSSAYWWKDTMLLVCMYDTGDRC